ncbi:MAG: helix-turn-helix domain-containing protein [Candidatus Paceibacterota bacterium]|jgi:DNA-binding HxlR family transcriptional regulator
MKKSQPTTGGEKRCDKVLKSIGDYWALSIIEALGQGERRFCELERAVVGVNPVTLTSRLKKMERIGLIKRRKESAKKMPVAYSLTADGYELLPIAEDIRKFAEGL